MPQSFVRSAREGDENAIMLLARQLTTAIPFDDLAFHPAFMAALRDSTATLLAAEYGDQIVGYLLGSRRATFWAGAEVWWVEECCVDAKYRHLGIGRALMLRFEELALRNGARLVCLVTGKAQQFYKGMGYEERAVYLRKDLRTDSP